MESDRSTRNYDSDNNSYTINENEDENDNTNANVNESIDEDFESLTDDIKNKLIIDESTSDRPHKRKIVFLIPFPLLKESEFDKKNKPGNQTVKINGLDYHVRRDKDGVPVTYKEHKEVIEDLRDVKGEAYKKAAKKSYKKIGEEIEIIGPMTIPTDPDQLESLKELIKNLQPPDQLYIMAHGNMNLIASRPFTLYITNLANLLIDLKIPNDRILVAIWACNSGNIKIPGFVRGFAENVHRSMTDKGYGELGFSGVNGYLYGSSTLGVYVKENDTDESKRKFANQAALSSFASPVSQKNIDEEKVRGGVFTGDRNTSEILARRKKEKQEKLREKERLRDLAKPLFTSKNSKDEESDEETSAKPTKVKPSTKVSETKPEATQNSAQTRPEVTQNNVQTRSGNTKQVHHRPETRSQGRGRGRQ